MPIPSPGAILGTLLLVASVLLPGCGGDDRSPSDAQEGAGPLAQLAADDEVRLGAAHDDLAAAIRTLAAADRAGLSAPVTVDYPLEGSLFPPDIVPPTVLWHDASEADAWIVQVTFVDGGEPLLAALRGSPPSRGVIDPAAQSVTNEVYEGTPYQQSARAWKIHEATWEELKRRTVDRPATMTLIGFARERPGTPLSVGSVRFSTSSDPVGAPIFYRDVPLSPSKGEKGVISPLAHNRLPLIAWRLRDVSKPQSRLLLTGMPSCANCHSFSLDGKTMGMDVDGPNGDKGAYMIAPVEKHMVITQEQVITWNDFKEKPEGHRTLGFLSRVSPTGRFVLTTLNESLYVRNFADHKFLQVFYPTRGILAWTSKETGEMRALPGADDPAYVHCDPAWFPDGKEIVFARARARDPYEPGRPLATYAGDPNETPIQYDLYRMPFDEGRGGTPVRIAGASENGMSNTFPKVSPDGRWIVFTQCANGQLMRPDGRLWILPAAGGEAREMRCNTALMNSWHSFSPNGRWMVFSSKVNTPYTQMFLTHLDEEGNDTPPILIPDSTAANRAVNIPEFLNAEYEALIDIQVPAVNHHRHFGRGTELMGEGRFAEAAAALEQALALDAELVHAHVNLGYCLLRLDRAGEARAHYERALSLSPSDPLALNALGSLAEAEGRLGEALVHFKAALAADPGRTLTRRNLGLAMARQGRLDDALVHLRVALTAEPRDLEIHKTLVVMLLDRGRTAQALPYLESVVALDGEDVQARTLWAWLLATSCDDGARDGKRAVQQARDACERTRYQQPETLDALAAAYAESGEFELAVKTAEQALALAPNETLAAQIRERLALYRKQKPYRTPGR